MNDVEPIARDVERYAVRVPEHVTWHDVDADLVVFNQRDGTYHALDRVGSEIWRALARDGRCGAVVAELRQRYPEDAAVIAQDVSGFLNQAARLGLLVVSEV